MALGVTIIARAAARGAALALCLLAAAGPAAAQTRFEPAAVVNDSVITRFDIEQRVRLLQGAAPRGSDLQAAALEQLITDRLRLEAAKRAGVAPSRAALDAAVADYAAQRNVSVEALDQGLTRGGVTRAALEDALSAEVAWRDVIRRRFGARAEPTDAEIDAEAALSASGQSRSFRLAEIAIPVGGRGEAAAREQADRLVAELRGGGDFAALARRSSAAPSAAQGGDIGWVAEAALPPAVVDAISGVADGGVTAPAAIPGGLMILKVLERRTEAQGAGTESITLTAVQGQGRGAAASVTAFLAGAPDCDAAVAGAQAAGLRAQRSDPTNFAALPPQVRAAVGSLQAGQSSAAVPVQGGAVGFVVCARESGLTAKGREELGRQIRQRRLVGFAAGYLQELRSEAVIELR